MTIFHNRSGQSLHLTLWTECKHIKWPCKAQQTMSYRQYSNWNPGKREHVSPGLLQLHWLPVRWRIQFKICTMMHSIHMARCPAYLNSMVVTNANSSLRSGMLSPTTNLYVTQRVRTKFSERAVSHAGPAARNSLPANIRAESSQTNFKKLLKTHLFILAYFRWLLLLFFVPRF